MHGLPQSFFRSRRYMVSPPLQENEAANSVRVTRSSPKSTAPATVTRDLPASGDSVAGRSDAACKQGCKEAVGSTVVGVDFGEGRNRVDSSESNESLA